MERMRIGETHAIFQFVREKYFCILHSFRMYYVWLIVWLGYCYRPKWKPNRKVFHSLSIHWKVSRSLFSCLKISAKIWCRPFKSVKLCIVSSSSKLCVCCRLLDWKWYYWKISSLDSNILASVTFWSFLWESKAITKVGDFIFGQTQPCLFFVGCGWLV